MATDPTPRSARYSQSNRAAVKSYVSTPISEERKNQIRNAPLVNAQPIDPRLIDHAKNILTPAPLDQDTKANAWEHYHLAKTPAELSTRLQGLNLPTDVQTQLLDAKQSVTPEPTAADKVTEVIQRMARIPQAALDLAEKHPTVLKSLLAGSEL